MKPEPWTLPPKQGLYDPTLEREACGVGFIVAIDGKRSHKVSRDLKFYLPSVKFKRRYIFLGYRALDLYDLLQMHIHALCFT